VRAAGDTTCQSDRRPKHDEPVVWLSVRPRLARPVGRDSALPASAAGCGSTSGGGARALLGALPAALPEAPAFAPLPDGADGPMATHTNDLATETVADRREAANQRANRVATTDLIHRALATGLTDAEARDLARRYHRLAGFWAPAGIAPADLAERTRLLLARTIEAELQTLGVWAVPRAALAGLHVRALVAAWTELTGAEPPALCGTEGCSNMIPATRNRRFCNTCILTRRRERARERRAAQRAEGGSGSR
jgi:hypothetical protein